MPIVRAVLTVAILASALGACAAVAGLDRFTRDDGCSAQGCDDATAPDAADDGSNASDGATADGATPGDDSDITPDASDGGTLPMGDSGCGPLNSVDNCGACGVTCNATTGTPSCTGATCTYVCLANRADCNMAPPNTDGCECATPGCCGSGCQTTHSDGVGQSYFDCNATGTYSQMSATEACTAYAKSVGSGSCSGPLTCKGSTTPTICFQNSSGTCANYCWQYSGKYADAGPGTVWDCTCPAHLIGSWN